MEFIIFNPPRYLFREFIIKRVMKNLPKGRFLEIGYGKGDLLLTLSQNGFYGDGFDFSELAFEKAKNLLDAHHCREIELLKGLPQNDSYDYILFFEVIGYFSDPTEKLKSFLKLIKKNGHIIFSFVREDAGYSPAATGNMRFFSKSEILTLLENCGYTLIDIYNYGFPIVNLLRPLHTLAHKRTKVGEGNSSETPIEETGLHPNSTLFKIAGLILNKLCLLPFFYFQILFKNSSLGNGFVVVACPKE